MGRADYEEDRRSAPLADRSSFKVSLQVWCPPNHAPCCRQNTSENHCDRTNRLRLRPLTEEFLRRAPAQPCRRGCSRDDSSPATFKEPLEAFVSWRSLRLVELSRVEYRGPGAPFGLERFSQCCSDTVAASQRSQRCSPPRSQSNLPQTSQSSLPRRRRGAERVCAGSLRLWQTRHGLDVRP